MYPLVRSTKDSQNDVLGRAVDLLVHIVVQTIGMLGNTTHRFTTVNIVSCYTACIFFI